MREAELQRTEVSLSRLGVQTVRGAAGGGVRVRDGKVGSEQKRGRAAVPLGGLSNL